MNMQNGAKLLIHPTLSIFFVALLTFFASPFICAIQAQDEIADPIEPVNRGIFWFNDKFDVNVLEPVAKGYDEYVPDSVQTGVGNFFDNLRYPQYLVSDLVQFKFTQAASHTGRFILNTTVGILGIVDVAKHIGLERHVEDFGLALAYHDVPPGPYIVLPFLGPSNLRDTVGTIVDSFLSPFAFLEYSKVDSDVATPVIIGGIALTSVHQRAGLLEAVTTAKESSVDYYLFLQSAYYQHRRGVLYDGNPPDEEDEDFSDGEDDKAVEELAEDQTAVIEGEKK